MATAVEDDDEDDCVKDEDLCRLSEKLVFDDMRKIARRLMPMSDADVNNMETRYGRTPEGVYNLLIKYKGKRAATKWDLYQILRRAVTEEDISVSPEAFRILGYTHPAKQDRKYQPSLSQDNKFHCIQTGSTTQLSDNERQDESLEIPDETGPTHDAWPTHDAGPTHDTELTHVAGPTHDTELVTHDAGPTNDTEPVHGIEPAYGMAPVDDNVNNSALPTTRLTLSSFPSQHAVSYNPSSIKQFMVTLANQNNQTVSSALDVGQGRFPRWGSTPALLSPTDENDSMNEPNVEDPFTSPSDVEERVQDVPIIRPRVVISPSSDDEAERPYAETQTPTPTLNHPSERHLETLGTTTTPQPNFRRGHRRVHSDGIVFNRRARERFLSSLAPDSSRERDLTMFVLGFLLALTMASLYAYLTKSESQPVQNIYNAENINIYNK